MRPRTFAMIGLLAAWSSAALAQPSASGPGRGRAASQSAAADVRPAAIYTKDNPPPTPKLEDLPLKDSLSQYGITWTFEKPARTGHFINGDWYVVGPVTVRAIDPGPLFGEEVKTAPEEQGDSRESRYKPQYARNGSTLNLPAVVQPSKVSRRTRRAGFDSRLPMDQYDPNQFTPLPISMKPGDSLVSSISTEPLSYGGYPVKALAVLTCVAEPQPADAFRPSFCQTATCKAYLARSLRRDLLPKLPQPATAGKVKPADYAGHFDGVWVDTVGFGRAMPRQKFTFVGALIASVGGSASLLLQLDYTPQEKEPLLVNMVQVGIDLYGILRGGGGWPAEGICGSGRKWLIVQAGLLLDDEKMYALTKSYPDGEFQEDEQTSFLPREYDGRKYERSWTGAKVVWTGHYGIRHGVWPPSKWAGGYGPVELFPPAEWPFPWPRSESDRCSTSSPHWVAEALAARLMHAEKVWDHDAFFAYVDRWMTEDDTKAIEEIKKNIQAKFSGKDNLSAEEKKLLDSLPKWAPNRQGTIEAPGDLIPVVKDLWTKYRNDLPAGPDGAKPPPAETTWK